MQILSDLNTRHGFESHLIGGPKWVMAVPMLIPRSLVALGPRGPRLYQPPPMCFDNSNSLALQTPGSGTRSEPCGGCIPRAVHGS